MSLIESIEDGKLGLSCLNIAYLNTQNAYQVGFNINFKKLILFIFKLITSYSIYFILMVQITRNDIL